MLEIKMKKPRSLLTLLTQGKGFTVRRGLKVKDPQLDGLVEKQQLLLIYKSSILSVFADHL